MSKNETPPRVGYARVSTADQNPDMQVEALKRYGVPERAIFVEHMSGTKVRRPQLEAALKMAQAPGTEFVVWKLDRLGRTMVGIIDMMQLIDRRGLVLVSITERFDLGTPMGKAMLNMLAMFAQLERDMIAERTKAGVARARERGGAHGRPNSMTPERAARAQELFDQGVAAAKALPVLQAMDGPEIKRSRVYEAWKEMRAAAADAEKLAPPERETDDR